MYGCMIQHFETIATTFLRRKDVETVLVVIIYLQIIFILKGGAGGIRVFLKKPPELQIRTIT